MSRRLAMRALVGSGNFGQCVRITAPSSSSSNQQIFTHSLDQRRTLLTHATTGERRQMLLASAPQLAAQLQPRRHIVSFVVRNMFKLRYVVMTGLVGGSVAARNYYDEWRSSWPELPELPKWTSPQALTTKLDDVLLRFDDWRDRMAAARREREEAARLKAQAVAAEEEEEKGRQQEKEGDGNQEKRVPKEELTLLALFGLGKKAEDKSAEEEEEEESLEERFKKQQEESIKMQSQYQREVERLEQENKVLRQRFMLQDTGAQQRARRQKRSLIDRYSEVLDLLVQFDAAYDTADNLPRVVVVGDQSAGKTSVLEMIAQARIFPRGHGEMMTRAPVQVTLAEGPYHVAQFRDSTREFDLTKEHDLQQLRNEIEVRMRNSVADGRSVSNEVISLTVKGPSLPRMVLVDLPGVISTVTADMALNTKNEIINMCSQYMMNPNAIILCIQDGSVDAERSNVTDLVSSIDPRGRRTILVMTKVDVAEQNLTNPDRIRRILEGKLLPLKALGHFGVVTGKGGPAGDESIAEIKAYEEQFFANSKLLLSGALKPSQLTTRNMSLAVADCFWRMVRESIEGQADAFRATRFNLETEWKNAFPRVRELDCDELFEKARGQILDHIVALSQVAPDEWEKSLDRRLWASIADEAFDKMLFPVAAPMPDAATFRTNVDIKLRRFVDTEFAKRSVLVGTEELKAALVKAVELDEEPSKQQPDSDAALFAPLKRAVVEEAMTTHQWDGKALDYLRNVQLAALEERNVPDRARWDSACKFAQRTLGDRLRLLQSSLDEARGPGWTSRWLLWRTPSLEQLQCSAIQDELLRLLNARNVCAPALTDDDVVLVRNALKVNGLPEVKTEMIRSQWRLLYKRRQCQRLIEALQDESTLYQHYKQQLVESELDCQVVVLFYRLERMLTHTCSALRQQIVNSEQRKLERKVKDVLDDWAQDPKQLRRLLVGRRVELAERLKQVRHVQESIEAFMEQLNREKP